jgi:hypothetical protein
MILIQTIADRKALLSYPLGVPRKGKTMKRIISLATVPLMLLMLFGLSGCVGASASDVVVAAHLVKYDVQGTEEFGFNVGLVTTDKNIGVEFVSFAGENVQGLAVELQDDTFEDIKKLKHKNYYIKLLGFICSVGNEFRGDESVRIDSVILKINGVEHEYPFSAPLKHLSKQEDSDDSQVSIGFSPVLISTTSLGSQGYSNEYLTDYSFEYLTESAVTITDFSFNDFLIVSDATISVNDTIVGNLSESLPLDVPKDATVTIDGVLNQKDPGATGYESIYCDSCLTYLTEKGDKIIFKNTLVSQGVSNEDDARALIEVLTK